MKALTAVRHSPILGRPEKVPATIFIGPFRGGESLVKMGAGTFFSWAFMRRSNSSRARASRSTATSGPLPERNTAWAESRSRPCRVATFRPTSVLPAPGTPVTNTIAFRLPVFVAAMIFSIESLVAARFTAPASLRVMS